MLASAEIDLGPENAAPVGQFPCPHLPEEGQVFLDRSGPVRRRATWLAETASIVLDLLVAQIVDVRLPLADQLLGQLVHLARSSPRRTAADRPKEKPSQLTSCTMDSTYSTPFGQRVGVVEAKVAMAAILLGHAEVQADRLGVTDVEIAVRLRGKAGDDAAVMLARAEVVLDDLADEIRTARSGAVRTCHNRTLPTGAVNSSTELPTAMTRGFEHRHLWCRARPHPTPGARGSVGCCQVPARLAKSAMLAAVSRLISGQVRNISVPWIVPMTWRQRALTPARSSRR